MKLTYKQIESAIYQVFDDEFIGKNRRQKRIDNCEMARFSVKDLVYLLHGAGDRLSIEIDNEVSE